MTSKKKLIYWLEVEKIDKTISRYSIYEKGRNIIIVNDNGYEHLMHPSAKSIEDEIRIVFKSKVLKTIMPGME